MSSSAQLSWVQPLPQLTTQNKMFAIVDTLVCDDASVFHWLTRTRMLCWVHDGRFYKKLQPVIALHRQQLQEFRKHYWEYYHQLLAYREEPTAQKYTQLEAQFDLLFATQTGYFDLDQRIVKTQAKKLRYCWFSNIPNSPCITMPPNWRCDSGCANAMSVSVHGLHEACKPGIAS